MKWEPEEVPLKGSEVLRDHYVHDREIAAKCRLSLADESKSQKVFLLMPGGDPWHLISSDGPGIWMTGSGQ